MLSDADRKWLEERDSLQFTLGRYYIFDRDGKPCPNPELDLRAWNDPLYVNRPDLEDALEFEAGVGRWLAMNFAENLEIEVPNVKPVTVFDIYRAVHKVARLAVEKEMDHEGN